MVTDVDHIQSLRNRLLQKMRANEAENAEIQEMLRTLSEAPKYLGGKPIAEHQEKPHEKPARYNTELSKQVADYITKLPDDTVINRREMIEKLKQEYGVKGKDKSLYAYISAILAKIAGNKSNELFVRYKKDVGFYKSRNNDKSDSVLVASV